MSELRFETLCIPAARLGPDNPLPRFPRASRRGKGRKRRKADPSLTGEDLQYMGYGADHGILPYTIQDGYTRALESSTFRSAVLENETLRAVFLPEMGGRLWSLLHKPSGRELLTRNPGIQLANFALRGAWFSGGVEWNGSVRGHGPFTCAPLFAARAVTEGGEPVLRLYEWERIRGVPIQMDFYLPDGSEVLLARMRLVNPHPIDVPMYWWSNIAVPEANDVRVVVPAREAIAYDYDNQLRRVPVPHHRERDVTYSTNLDGAIDFFYCLGKQQWPWIAALDGSGSGLFQASTARLRGRKLFAWGTGPGGKRWQQFLAAGGPPYIELQAGLALTQSHCLPMPAGVTWEWLEAYGFVEAPADAVHGNDWSAAQAEVEARIQHVVTPPRLEDELLSSSPMADEPPAEIVQRGSGWGALELQRRSAGGEPPFCSRALVFGAESMGAEQEPWACLLGTGAMPQSRPEDTPRSWMVQPEWRAMLEESVAHRGAHWLSWLHLGVMRHSAGEYEAARAAYEASAECAPSALAYRNMAVLARAEDRRDEAADLWTRAVELAPHVVPLILECARALMDADRAGDAVRVLGSVPPDIAARPRVRVVRAEAALATDDLETVEQILLSGVEVSDLREGEKVLSDLWFTMQEKRAAAAECVPLDDELRRRVRAGCPPPPDIDFRMSPEQTAKET